MFTVKEITDKSIWEGLVLSLSKANFLQSWQWGEFHLSMGQKIWRLGLYADKQLVGVAQLIKEEALRGSYLTVAGGPLIDWENESAVAVMNQFIKELAKNEHCVFVRIRPQEIHSTAFEKRLETLGYVPAPMHLTADLSLRLDLSKSDADLLGGMRKNTRYDVRRAEKLGITVTSSTNQADITPFYDLQLAVASKHHFVPFGLKFLKQQFTAFLVDDQVMLFHAYLGSQLLASAFVIFYNGEAIYHYGVSTEANAKLPGSHAVLWAAIGEAKRRNLRWFNFWGIAPEGNRNHRFAGVSLFKRGFGGEEVAYVPSHDLPIHWSYSLVRLFEFGRKKLRRL